MTLSADAVGPFGRVGDAVGLFAVLAVAEQCGERLVDTC